MVKKPWVRWAGLIVLGAVFEHYGLRTPNSHSTLSAVTRTVYRTETRVGRIAFLMSWGALTAWFVPHIVNGRNLVFPEKVDDDGVQLHESTVK